MRRVLVIGASVAVLVVLSSALIAMVVIWHSSRVIRSAEEDVRTQHQFRFAIQPLALPPNPGFEIVSSPHVFSQVARFHDHLYAAGPAGLMEYDSSGLQLHKYDVGVDLPASSLVALASAVLCDSRESELVIGTASAGLLAFNGQSFREIVPANAEARAITALLPVSSGHLLFGTKKRGVLVYDGKRIAVLHPLLGGFYVSALAGDESNLWVGTLDRGVLHFHGGEVDSFGEEQGLPDSQVLSLTVVGETAFVGTANGVAVFQTGHFSRVLAPGVMATALLATPSLLYVGSEDQGVIPVSLEGRRPNPNAAEGADLVEVHQLFTSGNTVFAVARDGLYRNMPHAFGWERVLQPDGASLTDRNVSALAADFNGHLWIGYFDRGLDVLASDRASAQHIENEYVFCVNRILVEPKTRTIDVATANGLVRFDESGSEEQVLTRADGLIADHVTDIVNYRDGLAVATPAGLTFLDAAGARSMYVFQGLVNNHVYALGVAGDELMAGTLGGLSRLNQGDISENYTTTTSNLKHNWITAVVPVGSEWIVGTYGAGVLEMDASRRFHTFEIASGAFEINPNAMFVTPGYVLAGTLGDGLFLYDRQAGRWSIIRDGLPSLNVTAFAAANGYVYIGTDNGLVRIPEQKLHS